MFVHATTKYPDKYLFQLHFRFSTAVDRAQPSTALCTAKSCTEYSQFICSVVSNQSFEYQVLHGISDMWQNVAIFE